MTNQLDVGFDVLVAAILGLNCVYFVESQLLFGGIVTSIFRVEE
jgi:hypothetical protein